MRRNNVTDDRYASIGGQSVQIAAIAAVRHSVHTAPAKPFISCGHCEYCKEGRYNLCNQFGFVGLQANGGFADYAIVDPHMLHRLPDHVTLEEGALVEPAAVCFHAVKESKLKVG
ncbi:alcohol dehydrogenase catalytic domain-containing protein [Paenibacillus sp. J5C_2022]|uniref:alcohol dehydrogenase catalytic domain-containing protein n=1 Tax=Paenibacillus sp. J5C2022 TaxID=2977129 RepID=UPI0021D2F149|nr:alcohol dehydrogenase catalytic domain-containing protein [Paenibacillus sp. J5C2022]MCU6710578.1 alcohol dehydrogenase catalytic domain-containing protein [Paenibacillus sp. J5C2022]